MYVRPPSRLEATTPRLTNAADSSSDAYAAVHLFAVLDHQRKNLDPVPDLPHHVELNKPIPVPKAAPKKATPSDSEEPEAESEAAAVEGGSDGQARTDPETEKAIQETLVREDGPAPEAATSLESADRAITNTAITATQTTTTAAVIATTSKTTAAAVVTTTTTTQIATAVVATPKKVTTKKAATKKASATAAATGVKTPTKKKTTTITTPKTPVPQPNP